MEFILLALMFVLGYFVLIRPQQKRMKAQQEAVAALQPGDRVLTHSGIFATISHIGEAQMILELAPGVEITVLKGAVARQARADEEEFEFADDAEVGAADAEPELTDGDEVAEEASAEASLAEESATETVERDAK